MEVIKVKDTDIQSALDIVKRQYGSDAMILEIRKKRKYVFGPSYYELLIGIEQSSVKGNLDNLESLEKAIKRLDAAVSALAVKEDELDALSRQTGFSKDILVKARAVPTEDWKSTLRQYLSGKLEFVRLESIKFQTFPKVVVLLGPTGVGKTTTAAKLAGYLLLEKNVSSGFVTIDTFRAGAVEQTKLFGRAMNLPVEVVRRPHQMQKVLAKFPDAHYVFVDTIGRNPKEIGKLTEIKMYLDELEEWIPVLCLNAGLRKEEMQKAFEYFNKVFHIEYFILTKVDEAEGISSAVEFMAENRLKTLALTDGQNVPDDLLFPDMENVLGMVGLSL
ncbi:MAG TPA: flagellar GTP-binding protein [Coprothermobacter sp.]|jgi:flagellar biosynthesis protein FlhF|nr:flagellar GTP-binding protein [Coprothermobacter sp.]